MNYNKAQDALIKAFKNSETIDKKALYLFFIKENTTHSDIKGHMPFNRQFGFIYAANQSITELTRTMAHELGHGAFRLKHTFSNENEFIQDQGQTLNLMDYASGSELLKYQWDECHDFDLGCNWFEDGDEAAIFKYYQLSDDQEKMIKAARANLRKKSALYSFIDIITDKDKETDVIFYRTSDKDIWYSGHEYGHMLGLINDEKKTGRIGLTNDAFLTITKLESTLSEEMFHYAQMNYYGWSESPKYDSRALGYTSCYVPKISSITQETEVRLFRYITGAYDISNDDYWVLVCDQNKKLLTEYIDCLKNHATITPDLSGRFSIFKIQLAQSVGNAYSIDAASMTQYIVDDCPISCFDFYIKKWGLTK